MGVWVEMLFPKQVMFSYILTNRNFIESDYRFEIVDFPLQRQVAVAAMFQRIL